MENKGSLVKLYYFSPKELEFPHGSVPPKEITGYIVNHHAGNVDFEMENGTYLKFPRKSIYMVEPILEPTGGDRLWKRSNGEMVKLKDMTTMHLKRSVTKLKRENDFFRIPMLIEELESRGEKYDYTQRY